MYRPASIVRLLLVLVVAMCVLVAVIERDSIQGVSSKPVQRNDGDYAGVTPRSPPPSLRTFYSSEAEAAACVWKLLLSPPAGASEELRRYTRELSKAASRCHQPVLPARPNALRDIRTALAKRIAALGEDVVPSLVDILRASPYREGVLVALAVEALSLIDGADADLLVIASDTEAEPWFRRHAAVALGRLRAQGVPALLTQMRGMVESGSLDSNRKLWFCQVGYPAVAHLVSELGSGDANRRFVAAWALRQLAATGGATQPATRALVATLADLDPRVRLMAVSALGATFGDGGGTSAQVNAGLVAALSDSESWVRSRACRSLRRQTQVSQGGIDELARIRDLGTDEGEVRLSTLALAKHAPGRIRAGDLPVLVEDLCQDGQLERLTATKFPDPEYGRLPVALVNEFVDLIAARVASGDCGWPDRALSVLCNYGLAARRAIPTLKGLLSDSGPLSCGVPWLLWIAGEDGVKDLDAHLHRFLALNRAGAARMLAAERGEISAEESHALRLRQDAERDPLWAHRPIECAALLGKRALPLSDVIMALAAGPHVLHEAAARIALVKIGVEPSRLVPILIGLLDDEWSRASAAEALGLLGSDAEEAVTALVSASSSVVRDVRATNAIRLSVAMALGQIGARPGEAVPALIGLLEHSSGAVRGAACVALGRFGPAARDAVPHLERLLALDRGDTATTPYDGVSVQRVAFDALERIR